MKHLVKFFVVTLFLFTCTDVKSEGKIVYLDMKKILNESSAGKQGQEFLQNSLKKSDDKFSKSIEKLKKEDQDLLKKKNELDKEEYKKKSEALRAKMSKILKERKDERDKINQQVVDGRKILLDKIRPILRNYIEENGISLIIYKRNIVEGLAKFNITEEIIEKLNKELPSLNLQ